MSVNERVTVKFFQNLFRFLRVVQETLSFVEFNALKYGGARPVFANSPSFIRNLHELRICMISVKATHKL